MTCDVSGVAQAVCRPTAGPPVPPDPSAVAVSQPQRATISCCGKRGEGRAEWEEYTPSRTQLPLGWRREALILRLWICSVILLIGLISFLANSPLPTSFFFFLSACFSLRLFSCFTDESIRQPKLFLCSSLLYVSIISEQAVSQRLLLKPVLYCGETTQLTEVKSNE